MVIGSVRYPEEQTPDPGRVADAQRPRRASAVVGRPRSLGTPLDLASLRRAWNESLVDFASLASQLHSRYGTSKPELNGRLEAVDRLMAALSGELPSIDLLVLDSPAPISDEPVEAPEDRPPITEQLPVVVAPPPVSAAPPAEDVEPDSGSRHDTVVMDAAAIRKAIAGDPVLAEVARRLESEEARHDTVPEVALLDDELSELAEDMLEEHLFEEPAPPRSDTRIVSDDEYRPSLRARETAEVELDDELDLIVDESARPPAPPDQRATAPLPAEEPEQEEVASGEWPREVELLYEDVHWLFQLGDIDGALISLERLLMLAPENEEIQAFVSLNEKKLLEIYQNVLGAWERVPRVAPQGADAHLVNHTGEKIRRILRLVDGKRTLRQILTGTNLGRLEACSALSQLARSRVIVFDEAAEA